MNHSLFVRLVCLLIGGTLSMALAPHATAQRARAKTVTRVFWQDRETDRLSWADIVQDGSWSIKRGWIKGFPKLDTEKQDLVQMKQSDGVLMVGVRDAEDGQLQSGWVAVDTGVVEEPHGNHTHWRYKRPPSVMHSRLDSEQGNPAHLYVYDGQFYLANDRSNGFTKAIPTGLRKPAIDSSVEFFSGGGNHITLAAVGNSVGYSTWIDGGGPNAGRVDVVDLGQKTENDIAYSFTLPSGVIHGATHNSGKVFFAPADGVCWVQADKKLEQSADTVEVHHLSLGTDAEEDKPLRTGAFANHRNWVMFTTGRADQAAVCLINAAADTPEIVRVPISLADGLRLSTPQPVLSLGRRYAVVFQGRTDAESDVQESLTMIELDPNGDRDLSDARVRSTIPVGASQVVGHHGHHAIGFDAYGRYALFSEPAEGILNVMSLQNMKIVARFRVGGIPDSIVVVGAPEFFH